MMLTMDGFFYSTFRSVHTYTSEAEACIVDCAGKLLSTSTSIDHPGMLLGKVQSGKTRTFLGVLALGFDNGYDAAIVLTKGTCALADQTLKRLEVVFEVFTRDDRMNVWDVMSLPQGLTSYELKSKLVIVCKKEDDNLRRLDTMLFKDYPELGRKRILIIDDEADFASVSFISDKGTIKAGTLSKQIDGIRSRLEKPGFLQVTATPYSLYLQPDSVSLAGTTFKPTRPAFTTLVPVHDDYIGGDFYFRQSEDSGSVASYLFARISEDEMDRLSRQDKRRVKLSEVLDSSAVAGLRHAVLDFIVGGTIRRYQQQKAGERLLKYCFIFHTETTKDAHEWQYRVFSALVTGLQECISSEPDKFDGMVEFAYQRLRHSVEAGGGVLPGLDTLKQEVRTLLPSICVSVVNSDKDVQILLDTKSGELHLRTPLNIFIGGMILDRGLTINNIIGFFYGRNPKKFQQDTVLQHARMYGPRPQADLAVTRLYTTQPIYDVLKSIHELDEALRETLKKGGHEAGVVFIQKDAAGRILPCSPNKLSMSTLTTLMPGKRLLPVGFQTDYHSHIKGHVQAIDDLVSAHDDDPVLVELKTAKEIISHIEQTLCFSGKDFNGQTPGPELFTDNGYSWDVSAFLASMEHCSTMSQDKANVGKVWLLIRKNRDLARLRADGSCANNPDTGKGEGRLAQQVATELPMLMLFRQNGSKKQGWMDAPFWWPVLHLPRNMNPAVFSSDIGD